MRIIGGHDYYDGAGMGVDTETVLCRSENPKPVPFTEFAFPKDRTLWSDPDAAVRRRTWAHLLAVVGSETVPLLLVEEIHVHEHFHAHARLITDPDEAAAEIRKLGEINVRGRIISSFFDRNAAAETLDFMRTPPDRLMGWAIDHRAAVAVIRNDPDRRDRVLAEINGAGLGKLGFMRVMDPATAHMRIAAFLSGVLPHHRETVTITDEDRARKAGFDQVSFRDTKRRRRDRDAA